MASGTKVKFTVILTDGTVTEKEIDVSNGLDAFEVWVQSNPGKTKEDFLDYMHGTKGDKGDSVITLNQDTPPPDAWGLDGTTAINAYNGDVYHKNYGTWTTVGNIRGPAGKNGGTVGYDEPTIITDDTDLGVIDAKYNDLLTDKTITKGVVYHYTQVTSGDGAVEYAGQGVLLSAVPAGEGVIATYAGVMAGSNKQMLRIRYSDGTNTALLVENTLERTLNIDQSLVGNGDVSDELRVNVSTAANNALALSTNAAHPGLYVPLPQPLKRGTGGGNFSFGYPDNKAAKNACGKMGTGVYWKVTISLGNAGAGNVAVMPRIWTNNIPCMEDGTLVPYQIVTDYVAANNNAVPSVAVWLVCMGVPTHLMDVTSGALKKLQRGDNGLTSGLDDLYPLAPEGEYVQEPQWSREYFYTA